MPAPICRIRLRWTDLDAGQHTHLAQLRCCFENCDIASCSSYCNRSSEAANASAAEADSESTFFCLMCHQYRVLKKRSSSHSPSDYLVQYLSV